MVRLTLLDQDAIEMEPPKTCGRT